MYPPNHPYSWPTIGAMTDLNGRRAGHRRLLPPLLSSRQRQPVHAGDFNPQEAKRMVAKYFGTLPGRPKGPADEAPAGD